MRRTRGAHPATMAVVMLALIVATTACSSNTEAEPWTRQVYDRALGLFSGSTPGTVTDDDPESMAVGEVVVAGTPLPTFVPGSPDAAVGLTAPQVHGTGFDGEPVAIVHDGTPKAVLFLAHWCPHCQNEVPRVQAWLDSGGGVPDVDIISVATSIEPNRPNHPPSAWLDREGWTPPVLVDDDALSAFTAYGAGGFPYWVFLDPSGAVVRRTAGELDISQLEQYLGEIVANA